MNEANLKTVVLCVTGSIAAYKAADLASRLTQAGYCVPVVMTAAATRFIAPLTFETLTHQPVICDRFEGRPPFIPDHIALADAADLVVIAPATANIIAKIAAGLADDMVSLTVVSSAAPLLIAPAMNDQMYANPILQANITTLKSHGARFIDPEAGMLACKHEGYGRLAAVDAIEAEIVQALSRP